MADIYTMDDSEKKFIVDTIASVSREHGKPCILLKYSEGVSDDAICSKVGGLPVITEGFKIPEGYTMMVQINCSELPENDIYPKNGWVQFWVDLSSSYQIEDLSMGDHRANQKVIYQPVGKLMNFNKVKELYKPDGDGNTKFFLYSKDKSMKISFSKGVSYPDLSGKYEKYFLEKYNKAYGTKYDYIQDIFMRFLKSAKEKHEFNKKGGLFAKITYFWNSITGNQDDLEKSLQKYGYKLRDELVKDNSIHYDRIGGYVSSITSALNVVGYDFDGQVILNLIPKSHNKSKAIVKGGDPDVYEIYWYTKDKKDIVNNKSEFTSTYF